MAEREVAMWMSPAEKIANGRVLIRERLEE